MFISKSTFRKLEPGVYGPLPTFFSEDQEVDFVSYKKHLLSEFMIFFPRRSGLGTDILPPRFGYKGNW